MVLTNAESGHGLADALLRPLFADERPSGTSTMTSSRPPHPEDARSVVGRYELRQYSFEVFAAEARLWCRITPRHEVVTMAALAGTVTSPEQYGLVHRNAGVYALVDGDDEIDAVEFLGRDGRGRARYLFRGGRAAPRTDGGAA